MAGLVYQGERCGVKVVRKAEKRDRSHERFLSRFSFAAGGSSASVFDVIANALASSCQWHAGHRTSRIFFGEYCQR